MCDDLFDEDGPSDMMDIKIREFDRINQGIEQTSFRDAFLESKEVNLQKGFEDGFKESYNNHSSVNLVKGFVTALLSSGIVSNSHQKLPLLIQLKEDLDNLDEKLSSVYEVDLNPTPLQVSQQSDEKQQIIASFTEIKTGLQSICQCIELNLSDEIINCKLTFSDEATTSRTEDNSSKDGHKS